MSKSNLINAIAPDLYTISNYMSTYAEADVKLGVLNVLSPWAKKKKTLYTLLGNRITVEKEVSFEQTQKSLYLSLTNLYSFRYDTGVVEQSRDKQKSPFVRDYIDFLRYITKVSEDDYYFLVHEILNANTLARNAIQTRDKRIMHYNGKKLIFQNGMRPMRALNKVIEVFGREHFSEFAKFREQHSNLLTTKKTEGKLVFSIHPMDYLTMSDNGNGWTSCMSWTKEGDYRLGTLEVMNSNNVLCCYLVSKDNPSFTFATDYCGNLRWNNKSWRTLIIVDKDIIVTSKHYPYINDELAKIALEEVRKMAKKNLHWEYKYGIQEYLDMKHFWKNSMIQNKRMPEKKNILLKGDFMYNDIMENENIDTHFWCVRNKVKKQKIISYAGPVYCLDCGKPLQAEEDEEGSRVLVCDDCHDATSCHECGIYTRPDNRFIVAGKLYCEYCFSRLRICPDCGDTVRSKMKYYVISNQSDIDKIVSREFQDLTYWHQYRDIVEGVEVATCENCYSLMVTEKKLLPMKDGYSPLRHFFAPRALDSIFVEKRLPNNWKKPI